MKSDIQLLSMAESFYQKEGFELLNVPYLVSREISLITINDKKPTESTQEGMYYVGSAEQSFLSLNLPDGNYVATTPCVREELQYNNLYRPIFMKTELFSKGTDVDYLQLALIAKKFFDEILHLDVVFEETDEGLDIVCKEVELGSYGTRQNGRTVWHYGTGLAMPRTRGFI